MRNIVFLGPPGAGKGTQAAMVAGKLNLGHIATGDLFRQSVEAGDELGKKVKKYLEKGELVPNGVTMGVMLERMSQPDVEGGAILDGFPRNLEQARALDEALLGLGSGINKVVYIDVPEEELVRRLSHRWVCRNCQAPCQMNDMGKNKAEKKCRRCGGELYQRPDDSPQTVKNRLKVYFSETAPLIDYYKEKDKLLKVEGQGGVDEVTDRIVFALKE